MVFNFSFFNRKNTKKLTKKEVSIIDEELTHLIDQNFYKVETILNATGYFRKTNLFDYLVKRKLREPLANDSLNLEEYMDDLINRLEKKYVGDNMKEHADIIKKIVEKNNLDLSLIESIPKISDSKFLRDAGEENNIKLSEEITNGNKLFIEMMVRMFYEEFDIIEFGMKESDIIDYVKKTNLEFIKKGDELYDKKAKIKRITSKFI